jgi:hypothetical protein
VTPPANRCADHQRGGQHAAAHTDEPDQEADHQPSNAEIQVHRGGTYFRTRPAERPGGHESVAFSGSKTGDFT